uniref:Protein disulfide-isomerase TMX3 (inferred by orthology to a human protein) n=1 Tax=Strongyloides venezuelensis TaxID=75913 RepID=A0A0K0F914_STRVS
MFLHFLSFICIVYCQQKPHSNVLELNDKFLDVKDEGMWFVAFYAPWCGHCKRLMPNWEHLAHAVADKEINVRIGKIDCTRFSNVGNILKIQGYPTIIFFKNGVEIHYEGERTNEKMLDFVLKSSGPVVKTINKQSDLTNIIKSSDKDPVFLFIGDESVYFGEFKEIAEKEFINVRFYKTETKNILPSNIKIISEPSVIVFKDKTHNVYPNDHGKLKEWILQEKWILIPQISYSNLHAIGTSSKKLLVLVVSDFLERSKKDSKVQKFEKVANEAALMVKKDREMASMFQFGWVDGNTIPTSIIIGNFDIPGILVFNYSSYEYYLCSDDPVQMTPKSIKTFLNSIMEGEIQQLGGNSLVTNVRRSIFELCKNVYEMFVNQPILASCLFGVPIAFFSIITYSICSSDFSIDRDEIYSESETEEDELEESEEQWNLIGNDSEHEKVE